MDTERGGGGGGRRLCVGWGPGGDALGEGIGVDGIEECHLVVVGCGWEQPGAQSLRDGEVGGQEFEGRDVKVAS